MSEFTRTATVVQVLSSRAVGIPCVMTEARIERVADALELIVQARLKRVPTQSELRDEAKKLLTGYLASRAARASREDQSKAPYAADLTPAPVG